MRNAFFSLKMTNNLQRSGIHDRDAGPGSRQPHFISHQQKFTNPGSIQLGRIILVVGNTGNGQTTGLNDGCAMVYCAQPNLVYRVLGKIENALPCECL